MNKFLFALLIISASSGAQCQIINGGFTQFNTSNSNCIIPSVGGTCPSFPDDCVVGWKRSHGTPQILSEGSGPSTNYFAYMFSQCCVLVSEGVYTTYAFSKNRVYTVSFDSRWVQNTQLPMQFNNVNVGPIQTFTPVTGNCQETYPSGNQQLTSISTIYNTWHRTTFSFLSNNDYPRLIFSPSTDHGGQFGINIDNVDVTTINCDVSIPISTGVLAGSYGLPGEFVIGSTSAADVTTNPTSNVDVVANNSIRLIPGFSAKVTTGTFVARLQECEGDGSAAILAETAGRENYIDFQDYRIAPNPVSNSLTIKLPKENKIDRIQLLSGIGQVLKTINVKNQIQVIVDFSGLKPGIYYLSSKGSGKIQIKKIIKTNSN